MSDIYLLSSGSGIRKHYDGFLMGALSQDGTFILDGQYFKVAVAARLANYLLAHLPETATAEGAEREAEIFSDTGPGCGCKACQDRYRENQQAAYWLRVYVDSLAGGAR